jgi:hypothetical protein
MNAEEFLEHIWRTWSEMGRRPVVALTGKEEDGQQGLLGVEPDNDGGSER